MHSKAPKTKDVKDNVIEKKVEFVHSKDEKQSDILLNESINAGQFNLEETCDLAIDKTYKDKCDDCDYEAEANKKYCALQLMIKHREACHYKKNTRKSYKGQCTKCEFKAMD